MRKGLAENTTGALSQQMPVVSGDYGRSIEYAEASATVAICVLSPISAMKNAMVVAAKGARATHPGRSSSKVSGLSVQRAMPIMLAPTTPSKALASEK